jgi:hypothetical protein
MLMIIPSLNVLSLAHISPLTYKAPDFLQIRQINNRLINRLTPDPCFYLKQCSSRSQSTCDTTTADQVAYSHVKPRVLTPIGHVCPDCLGRLHSNKALLSVYIEQAALSESGRESPNNASDTIFLIAELLHNRSAFTDDQVDFCCSKLLTELYISALQGLWDSAPVAFLRVKPEFPVDVTQHTV